MARKFFERRSLSTALLTYLTARGFSDITEIREGFQLDDQISPPMVSVYFLPSVFAELEMGRGNKKSLKRRVQFDAYMESEHRADAISDDIGDFVDETTITVKDAGANEIATMLCFDTASIIIEVVPPILRDPKIIRWRAVIRATYEVDYLS